MPVEQKLVTGSVLDAAPADQHAADARLVWTKPVLECLSVKSTATSNITFTSVDADANYS